MKWYIADSILVDIVSFILIPIIAIKFIEHERSVSAHIEAVSEIIVQEEFVLIAACLHLHRPAILEKCIVMNHDAVRSFHEDANCILVKDVVVNIAVRNILQQYAVR